MHPSFLQDLAVVMIVAGLVTVIFHRLRQPVVLGYILAGVIVGPHTTSIPLSIRDVHTVEMMSELGVILLMFGLGLHFSLRRLAQVGGTAFLAASMEIILMIAIGYGIGQFFGWSRMDSLFLGAILSISSTTIIVKALAELGMTKQRFADLIFGILIVEDILAIAMIALLSSIARTGTLGMGELTETFVKLAIFITIVLIVGLLVVPPLLRHVNRFKSNETLLITALALCFGVSLLALSLGYSVALGAFLIGAIVAEARERGKIELLIEPVRDMFSAIFFVAIGMLIDPSVLKDHLGPIVVVTLAVIVGKVFTCTLGTFIAGNDARTSLRVGMGLAQIGEFSFIIAQLGLSLGKTSAFLYPIAVTVSAITTLLTPYLIRSSDTVVGMISRATPKRLSEPARVYSQWMSAPGSHRTADQQIRRLLRKWIIQIVLNLALVTGIFIAAVAGARYAIGRLPNLPHWIGGSNATVWLAAMLLSLPLLIATIRKLRAMATVIAEMSVPRAAAGEQAPAIRAVVANTIFIAGSTLIAAFVLLLGFAILPPWYILIVLLPLIAAIAVLMWGSFVKLYAKAQISLHETLTHPPEPEEPRSALPGPLREAQLETIQIVPGSRAAGKLIRELELRTRSGASAIGIERDGTNIINPGPDEELLPGDKVLLLGHRAQLDAARELLDDAQ